MCEWDCSYKCQSDCSAGCQSDCVKVCADSCDTGCYSGCTGTCRRECTGCSGSCSGCSGTCTGSCTSCRGSCTGSCVGSCVNRCNTACTAEAQADVIAHLGENIAAGNLICASEYLQLKSAIDAEYTRRGKAVPAAFEQPPAAKGLVLLSVAQKVLTDVYEFDGSSSHDWRQAFAGGQVVPPSKWQPAILYIKELATQIVP